MGNIHAMLSQKYFYICLAHRHHFYEGFFLAEETHFTVVNYRSFTQLSKPGLKNVYERYSGGSR